MPTATQAPQDNKKDIIGDQIRENLLQYSKDFKTSWIQLGQTLYTAWKDKLYCYWGYEKFEDYTGKELSLHKQLSVKLLKSYSFLEKEVPQYLKKEYAQEHETTEIPHYDAVNLLRLASKNKDLEKMDLVKLKKDVFEKGKDAAVLRKDLTTLIRERKEVDPEEEREQRSIAAVKRLINAINLFQKDTEALKLLPKRLIKEADNLKEKLEVEIS